MCTYYMCIPVHKCITCVHILCYFSLDFLFSFYVILFIICVHMYTVRTLGSTDPYVGKPGDRANLLIHIYIYICIHTYIYAQM